MTTILGIDDAGRGSVIGPMVISGLLIEEKDIPKLKEMGVTDSKLLSPIQREELEPKIKKIAKDYVVLKTSAQEIDKLRRVINLNKIEANMMAKIIGLMKADRAIVDAPQISTEKFADLLRSLVKTETKIICENKTELKYPEVAAASILSKVERDREVERIKKKVDYDFGVGYPHDERSIKFIKKCIKEKKNLNYIRQSWTTFICLKNESMQKTLGSF